MAHSKESVLTCEDHLIVCKPTICDDELADDDSWAENLSEDDDENIFEINERCSETDPEKSVEDSLYNAIDFTLHTIVEESCEESEMEPCNNRSTKSKTIQSSIVSPSDLERYFFFGLVNRDESNSSLQDSSSEVFSDLSDIVDPIESNTASLNYSRSAFEMSSSRLEKYFLSGFMGFGIENKSDGSVGSDSEGHPTPNQRKKKLRTRGTPRSNHSSLDNLLVEPNEFPTEQFDECLDSSESEIGFFSDEVTLCDKSVNTETVKRKKNLKKREFDQKLSAESGTLSKSSISTESETNGKHQILEVETYKKHNPSKTSSTFAKQSIVRNDSFNNWSSDEETNLMMSKMRTFFKTLIAVKTNCSKSSKYSGKDIQFSYFDNELVRLMKTVPGIKSEQVREIVEYLSSEDAWSDSNDSSDFNGSNVEIISKLSKQDGIDEYTGYDFVDRVERVTNEANNTENASTYTNLMESVFSRNSNKRPLVLSFNDKYSNHSFCNEKSHQLLANVWKHMGKKLINLMHEGSIETDCVIAQDCEQKKINQNTEEITNKTFDNLDCTTTRTNQRENLTRSKSHDILLENSNRSWHFNSVNPVNENNGEVSDGDRFSWRGSFESTLLAPGDSRNKLLPVDRESNILISETSLLKRGSVDNLTCVSIQKQLDRVQSCGSISRNEDKMCAETHKIWLSSFMTVSKSDNLEKSLSKRTIDEKLECTNSIPGFQSLAVATNISKKKSDLNFVQSNVKSARYRSPTVKYMCSPASKSISYQTMEGKYLSTDQKNIKSRIPLGDFSVSPDQFSILNKSPVLQANKIYKRNSTYFGIRSDSMTSVYSDAFDNKYGNIKVRGQIKFGMQYNYKIGALEIHIVRCKDLAAADVKKWKSDPYVKVYLLPDRSKSGKRKTKIKKQSLHPVFDETVRFYLPLSNLRTRSLWLTVWHSDVFGRNDFLGEVNINLEGKVFDKPQSKWYSLQEKGGIIENYSIQRGDLVVALKFIHSNSYLNLKESFFKRGTQHFSSKGQLHVLIKEAKNLHCDNATGACDTFCKSYLLPIRTRSTKQKTSTFKKSLNPIWNHTFVYDGVTIEELSERALELTIWEHDRLISNQFIGGARLSLGTGKFNLCINSYELFF